MDGKKIKLTSPRVIKEIKTKSQKNLETTKKNQMEFEISVVPNTPFDMEEQNEIKSFNTMPYEPSNPILKKTSRNLPTFMMEDEEEEEPKVERKSKTKSSSFSRRSQKIVVLPGNTIDSPKSAKVLQRDLIENFLEKIQKDLIKQKEWKNFLTKHFVIEHFNYYKEFEIYKNETNEEEKKKLAKNLFENFINPNGKTPISLSHFLVQKVKKLYEEEGSDKGFYQVYQQVRITFYI